MIVRSMVFLKNKSLITTQEWSKDELEYVLNKAFELKKTFKKGRYNIHKKLEGYTLIMLFFSPSTRTRNSFEVGMTQLGGHAIYIDAGTFLPHIPQSEFPGQALTAALYLEGGIRGVEIGSVMFAHPDPESGEMIYPKLELVRLAIPRRVYTQSHLDFVVNTLIKIADQRKSYHGYRLTYSPELLRHFTARFELL